MSERDFKPAWWLTNEHLQTVWSTLCRKVRHDVKVTRERFELSDGDFLDLDWCGSGHGPIVILLHGLEGSIHSPYVKGMLHAIQRQGWRGVLMHFRCCSEELNRLPRTYHSGETGDINTLVQELVRREPGVSIAVLGFSLGGNVLLKWLGESPQSHHVKAAIAVSVPFELSKSVDKINQGLSKFYQWHFIKSLHKKMLWKFGAQGAPFPVPPLSKLRTIRDFDNRVTAPLHGFDNAEDYYTQSSSRQFLRHIDVPTLLLQAKDDPFMTLDLLPTSEELSSSVTLELSEKGGHVGFVSGSLPWRAEYWLEKRIPAFLSNYL
jgi:predicted alpha/beta-fold hydrolase